MDFDKLAMETMELSETMGGRNPFEVEAKPVEEVVLDKVEESIGLFYRVEMGSNTFCIRGVATENVEELIQDLENGSEELITRLKVESVEHIQQLDFYETEDMFVAERIVGQVVNRRFPYNEELLCNLSDPGFNWWLGAGDSSFQIYFTSNFIDRGQELINLGPIGNSIEAQKKFMQATDLLSLLFPVAEYSYSDKFVKIASSEEDNHNFIKFFEIFLNGTIDPLLWDEVLSHGAFETADYLRTIAATRTFWTKIVGHINT